MDAAALETVASARRRIQEILSGRDQRLLVVVGPCSVHDVKAAREYAQRLAPIRERLKDQLEVVMRVYFEKPRTTVGWKGLINDPHLDDSYDINTGLRRARDCCWISPGRGCLLQRNCSIRWSRSTSLI